MTSGAKVVIAMFAATGAIAVIVVAAFLLTNTDAVRCAEGELQDNAVRADGRILPRVETFSTLDEAESFICRRIPHPRSDDLTLRQVKVARERNLGDTIEGEGGADIEMEYALANGHPLIYGVLFPGEPVTKEPGDEVRAAGESGRIQRVGDVALVRWYEDGFSYAAQATLDADFSEEDFLRLLGSVR